MGLGRSGDDFEAASPSPSGIRCHEILRRLVKGEKTGKERGGFVKDEV